MRVGDDREWNSKIMLGVRRKMNFFHPTSAIFRVI